MLLAPLAALFLGGGTALAATCNPAGTTGLTAAVIASSAQYITGTIDATGCDIGIYVGPSGAGTIISFASVSNANVHGIFIQDTSNVQVRFSTVSNNDVGGTAPYPESKAIQAEGSRNVAIVSNIVTNNGDGGIAITDDGPFNPGAPNSGSLRPGYGNVVAYNFVRYNGRGCGIVFSAYNPGGGVSGNLADHNTVMNNSAGIVDAADAPNTTATNNSVTNNTSAYNGYAGIIVHSNAPGDVVSNTMVQNNVVHDNGGRVPGNSVQTQSTPPLPMSLGIVVSAPPPDGGTLLMTYVSVNHISNEDVGIAHFADVFSFIVGNTFSNVNTNVAVIPGP